MSVASTTVPAVVSVIVAVTAVVSILISASKIIINEFLVSFDRVFLNLDLDETDNAYTLKLLKDNNVIEEVIITSTNYNDSIIGLEPLTSYKITISNDYRNGETVLKTIKFNTINQPIVTDVGKIMMDNYERNNNQLTIKLSLDDPFGFLYAYKFLLSDGINEVEILETEFNDEVNFDLTTLNRGNLTLKIYAKSNMIGVGDNYIGKNTYKIRY